MPKVINFYLDDSGTRHPDHKPGKRPAHGADYFALGGILVTLEDEIEARRLHTEFCDKWELTSPIHSSEVRGRHKGFLWLEDLTVDDRKEFYEALYQLMKAAPVVGLACIIDRPGYNERYKEKYGDQRWMLCKTAFNIAVERAAKYANEQGCRLRVSPEKCNKPEDALLKGYFGELKNTGMPFEAEKSEKYGPLSPSDFAKILYEFKPKAKSSPMAQLADLYLWPMCMNGYHETNWTYRRLKEDGKLIEHVIPTDAVEKLGTK